MFYDAYTWQEDEYTYRELLLTDNEETGRTIRFFRPRHWAVCAARPAEVPSTREEAEADYSTGILLLMCSSSARGLHRYARTIITQRGDHDCVDPLLGFFRRWLPQIIAEKRLFLAHLPEDLADAKLERAIGAACAVD